MNGHPGLQTLLAGFTLLLSCFQPLNHHPRAGDCQLIPQRCPLLARSTSDFSPTTLKWWKSLAEDFGSRTGAPRKKQ